MFVRKFLLFAFFLISSQTECLKSTQFCYNNQKQCNKEDLLRHKSCIQQGCNQPFGYTCGLSHCSINEASCKSLFRLKHEIRSLNSLRTRMGIERMFEKKLEINNKFLESIRACHQHEWKITDVCLRGNKCRIHQKIPLVGRFGTFEYKKTVDCPCIGDYSYECNQEICSKDKYACDEYHLKTLNIKPKKCLIKNYFK